MSQRRRTIPSDLSAKLRTLTAKSSPELSGARLTQQDIADALEAGVLQQDGTGRITLAPAPADGDAGATPRRGKPKQIRRTTETPLAWLARRTDKSGQPLLSETLHTAGKRLAADFHNARMAPQVTMSWTPEVRGRTTRRAPPSHHLDVSERTAAAAQRVRAALAEVGPELSGILIDVCCFEIGLDAAERAAGWPSRSGKVVLLIALERLAHHYGLASPPSLPRRIRHWATEDYRPRLTQPPQPD